MRYVISARDGTLHNPGSMRKCNTWRGGLLAGTLGGHGKIIQASQSGRAGQDNGDEGRGAEPSGDGKGVGALCKHPVAGAEAQCHTRLQGLPLSQGAGARGQEETRGRGEATPQE